MELNLNHDNVMSFKLINDMELIGKLLEETEAYYEIDDCFYWSLVQAGEGKADVRFAPLTVAANLPEEATHMGLKVRINKSIVFFSYEPRPEVVSRYKSATSPIILN